MTMIITPRCPEIAARTCFGEARSEGYEGMVSVAWVLVNRANDRRWPENLGSVCTQPWQFSCWNDGDPNREKLLEVGYDDEHFRLANAAVWDVLAELEPDPTGGANHYFADWLPEPPRWAAAGEKTAEIGRHLFYKL